MKFPSMILFAHLLLSIQLVNAADTNEQREISIYASRYNEAIGIDLLSYGTSKLNKLWASLGKDVYDEILDAYSPDLMAFYRGRICLLLGMPEKAKNYFFKISDVEMSRFIDEMDKILVSTEHSKSQAILGKFMDHLEWIKKNVPLCILRKSEI